MRPLLVLALLATGFGSSAQVLAQAPPQRTLDQRLDFARRGDIELTIDTGEVEVIGIDQRQVQLQASGEGASALDIRYGDRWLIISSPPASAHDVPGRALPVHLRLEVPVGSRVSISTLAANIEVRDVDGELTLESISGTISVEGRPRRVAVETVTGDVTARVDSVELAALSVSGVLRIAGRLETLRAEQVDSQSMVNAEVTSEAWLTTASGTVAVDGRLAPSARLRARAASGTIQVRVDEKALASLALRSFSGDLDNQLTGRFAGSFSRQPAYPAIAPRHFEVSSSGSPGAQINIETIDGTIRLQPASD